MEIIRSTPGELTFLDIISKWMDEQRERTWIVCPFIDNLGVALINSKAHGEVKIICRRSKEIVDLRSGVSIKLAPKIHIKLYIGDNSVIFGSANLNLSSFMYSQELLMRFSEKKVLEKFLLYFNVLWG